CGVIKAKGAFVSESALHSFDGDKPNSVGPESVRGLMIIHLIRPAYAGRMPGEFSFTVVRRYPRINRPAALPLFCLAPHGVFRASQIAPRAVSSYLAFSPLPMLFSKNRRCLFCDTFHQSRLWSGLPAYFTRHAAVWCSDFPPISLGTPQRSSAIGGQFSTLRDIWKPADQAKTIVGQPERLPYNQNGECTFTRKIVIIASPMISLASMAPMFPSKLPHPARPASIM